MRVYMSEMMRVYMSEMMCVYISKMNIFVDFVLNKNDRGINNTRKTS